MLMSQKPWCTAPSPPTRPARSRQRRTASPCKRDFLEGLIEGALHKRRVHREERLRRPVLAMPAIMSSACDSQMPVSHVRSGNLGITLARPRAVGHRGGAGDDLVVTLHHVGQGVGVRAGERAPGRLEFHAAALDGERLGRVERGRVALGELVPLALDGVDVQHHRAVEVLAPRRGTSMRPGRSWPSTGPTVSRPNFSNHVLGRGASFAISPRRW
jgi:hypothetical protein